jgi:hypothetical protein
MILWSKGMGKLVLSLRLRDRSGMASRDEGLVIEGVMGQPTYWDYAVTLGEEDVLDFLELLKQPQPTRFVVMTEKRWAILGTALASAAVFAFRTVLCFLGGGRRGAGTPDAPRPPAGAASGESDGDGHVRS